MNLLKCPNVMCGYMINKKQWNAGRFDYECPKCRQYKLSQFKSVDAKEKDAEKIDKR